MSRDVLWGKKKPHCEIVKLMFEEQSDKVKARGKYSDNSGSENAVLKRPQVELSRPSVLCCLT